MTRLLRNRGPEGPILFHPLARDEELLPPLWLRRALVADLGAIERRFSPITRTERVIDAPLGCGAFGCVFALADGRVLKVTSDHDEGPATERIRLLQSTGRKIESRSILAATARIDAVFRLKHDYRVDTERSPLYGIVRERVGDAGEDIPMALANDLDFYTDGWDAWGEAEEGPGRLLGVTMARVGLSFLRDGAAEQRWMGALLAALWRDGYPLMDAHRCNVARRLARVGAGTRAGQIVFFDFGGGASCPMGHFARAGNGIQNKAPVPRVEIGTL